MPLDLTKVIESVGDLIKWNRKGFDDHARRMANHAENTMVGSFVRSQAEFDATVEASPSQAEIFNTWYRYSHHTNGQFPGLPAELLDWRYDEATGLISNTFNSSSVIGVVSPLKYRSFVLDVDVWSTHHDDDLIGLTPCFYRDPATGKEHTLTVFRTPGGLGRPLYEVIYNSDQPLEFGRFIAHNATARVFWGNGQPGTMSASQAGYNTNQAGTLQIGWSGQKIQHGGDGKIRIRVTRDDDLLTFQTSTWSDPETLIPSSLLTLDLSSHPRYNVFRGGSQYGFTALSQPNSFWKIREFSNPNDAIYRLDTGKVYTNVGGVWKIDAKLTLDQIRKKSFLLNPYTGQSFFFEDKNNIISLASHMVK